MVRGTFKMSSDQVPKEAKIASLLLNSSGIQECEPKVVQQLMEFMFSTVFIHKIFILELLFRIFH